MLQEAGHVKNIVILIFQHIQCLHLMNSEVAWVLVSWGTQVQPQIILDPDDLPDYLSVSYDMALTNIYWLLLIGLLKTISRLALNKAVKHVL